MKLILRWLILAVALFLTALLLPGIHIQGTDAFLTVIVMALVLGFVNAIIRPILKFLSCGLIILTLGLFSLVINALTFWLAAEISTKWFGATFSIDNFGWAILGSIIVSLISMVLSSIVIDEKEKRS